MVSQSPNKCSSGSSPTVLPTDGALLQLTTVSKLLTLQILILKIHFVFSSFFFSMFIYYSINLFKKLSKIVTQNMLCNFQCLCKYLALGRNKSYFVKSHFHSNKKFFETDINKMLIYC